MDLGHLKSAKGSKKRSKRVGRGTGSGHGKTACRGNKGQKSRSGAKTRSWFEGGQMPLQRRLPKRGFTNIFKKSYQIVNVGDLDRLDVPSVSPETLIEARIIRKKHIPVKILGDGELTKKCEVSAHAFSKRAKEKIEAAGGKATVL